MVFILLRIDFVWISYRYLDLDFPGEAFRRPFLAVKIGVQGHLHRRSSHAAADVMNVLRSLWPRGANEYVDKLNFSALVQYKTSDGSWITLIDLVRDISLSKNRLNQNHFSFILLNSSVNALRIGYTGLIPYGSSNKGRISIGELNILHE